MPSLRPNLPTIQIPSLEEQKAIVEKLEKFEAEIAEIETHLAQKKAELAAFLESTFGKL